MFFVNLVLLAVALSCIFLGLTVLVRNVRDKTNQSFAAIAVTAGLWGIGIYLFEDATTSSGALNAAKFYYVDAAAIAFFLHLFSVVFTKGEETLRRNKLIWLSGILLIALSIQIIVNDTFILKEITPSGNGWTADIQPYGYLIYSAYFVAIALIGFSRLVSSYFTAIGNKKTLIGYTIVGIGISFLMGMYFNLLLPAVGNYDLVWVGPVFTLLYVGIISYAITRHKLFDVRAAIARSLTYILSLAVILALVAGMAALIGAAATDSGQSTSSTEIIFTALAIVIAAVSYGPLKQRFDRATSKIFYRDSYEAQALLDDLNKIFVSVVDMNILLNKTADTIKDYVQVSFCEFYVQPTLYMNARTIGQGPDSLKLKSIEVVDKHAHTIKDKVISADDYDPEGVEARVVTAMDKDNVSVIARLVNDAESQEVGVGYLLLGPKKSGAAYTDQDLKIIGIIANGLVVAVENILRFEEIQQFNVTLQKKINDATRKLQHSNEKLKALDEAKDEFVSMASHQLRTPLTTIKGYLSMVLEGDAGDLNPTQKDMLGQAFFSSQRMVYLIADLLNVSRLRTGKFMIESAPVYLPDVVESEISQVKEGAKAKKIKLNFTKPKRYTTYDLDETKIRQVIMNFTDNAIYYTSEGGSIDIELKDRPHSIEFTVTDTGIGVPKDQQHKLFTKFYRADNARKSRPDGTGLGLFMAKKVIIAQGGSVVFKSREGHGSTFGFSFPKTNNKHTSK